MSKEGQTTFVGLAPIHNQSRFASGEFVELWGETYYRISHHDQMPPFFISLVSGADHWLFISSNGGLTAGRVNAESALFPYETEDKITANREHTGSKTLMRVSRNGLKYLWEPFSDYYAGIYHLERNIYKNIHGNKIVFEEINHDLGLRLRTAWRTTDRFGFVRSSWLDNIAGDDCEITVLDGLQNILPYGATVRLQTEMSNLLHAYKRNELVSETGLGIFALSATLTDQPEPSESLMATVAWQIGLDVDVVLLCSRQVEAFRRGGGITTEHDICGRAGAYFVGSTFGLSAGAARRWHIVADVNYDAAAIVQLNRFLRQPDDQNEVVLEAEIEHSTSILKQYVAAADGLQVSGQTTVAAHHYANTLFNIMRGGIFPDGYTIMRDDFLAFVLRRNKSLINKHRAWFDDLPSEFNIQALHQRALEAGIPDIIRLCLEYLPLTFSRRHGDPSRPWNQFSINLKHPDGSPRLDYQGNWRDIFQNWEPLMLSFPGYLPNAIARFLNATTADGYNPYRVTRDGIEWEVPEPNNPWSNIGYWSDHQIIYLQKLLEIARQVGPSFWADMADARVFAYADVPYRLHSYQQMREDWYNTISFDQDLNGLIEDRVADSGTDGRLLHDADGNVVYATLTEKLLTLLLAKVTNLVPEGGIWMNTQRPEWNDANNALVGKGLSVVTGAYLRRFVKFWVEQLENDPDRIYGINVALAELLHGVSKVLSEFSDQPVSGYSDQTRGHFMDALGSLATTYRTRIYEEGVLGRQTQLGSRELKSFLGLVQRQLEHTLQCNRRSDGLFHAYNILNLTEDSASIKHLYLMLEGQVAILSSGILSPLEALELLRVLRQSDLYRQDQHSYMLYPNRRLSGFLQKNNILASTLEESNLAQALAMAEDERLLKQDAEGIFHFNGTFRNANDVVRVLDQLELEPAYSELVKLERSFFLTLYESVFIHQAFTGRSGTFFAFEGLGSVYWHMVAKLLLAIQEIYFQALAENADEMTIDAIAAAYKDIRQGIGYQRSPTSYGAFPTDPYSHTPITGGARQPGMTGQVKEEILTRWGELGLTLDDGQLRFSPTLLELDEFSGSASSFVYVDVLGHTKSISLPRNSLAFTFCQTPIVYILGEKPSVIIYYENGEAEEMFTDQLAKESSRAIMNRTGEIRAIYVNVSRDRLGIGAMSSVSGTS